MGALSLFLDCNKNVLRLSPPTLDDMGIWHVSFVVLLNLQKDQFQPHGNRTSGPCGASYTQGVTLKLVVQFSGGHKL